MYALGKVAYMFSHSLLKTGVGSTRPAWSSLRTATALKPLTFKLARKEPYQPFGFLGHI
jgi:hypothetical protein